MAWEDDDGIGCPGWWVEIVAKSINRLTRFQGVGAISTAWLTCRFFMRSEKSLVIKIGWVLQQNLFYSQ